MPRKRRNAWNVYYESCCPWYALRMPKRNCIPAEGKPRNAKGLIIRSWYLNRYGPKNCFHYFFINLTAFRYKFRHIALILYKIYIVLTWILHKYKAMQILSRRFLIISDLEPYYYSIMLPIILEIRNFSITNYK